MSNFTILAFMAESGHGKDFCGKWVIDNKHFAAVAFADPLKRLCKTVFTTFTEEALWGDANLRNNAVLVDWDNAQYRLEWGVDDWLFKLNLSVKEKANYKPVVHTWFERIRLIAEKSNNELSPRVALQLLGTEYGRTFKKDLWASDLLGNVIPKIQHGCEYNRQFGVMDEPHPYDGVVITDCRFDSEREGVQSRGGKVIKLIRNSKVGEENTALLAGVKNHVSEVEILGIPENKFDCVLRMGDGAENVYPALQAMFDKWDLGK